MFDPQNVIRTDTISVFWLVYNTSRTVSDIDNFCSKWQPTFRESRVDLLFGWVGSLFPKGGVHNPGAQRKKMPVSWGSVPIICPPLKCIDSKKKIRGSNPRNPLSRSAIRNALNMWVNRVRRNSCIVLSLIFAVHKGHHPCLQVYK